MTFYYLDSSAWLKRYFLEPGTDRIRRLFQSRPNLASSGLGYVEVSASLVRQQPARGMSLAVLKAALQQLDAEWDYFLQVELSHEIIARAARLSHEWKLRGADAIHLAAADFLRAGCQASGHTLVFLGFDQELTYSAEGLGMTVEGPVP